MDIRTFEVQVSSRKGGVDLSLKEVSNMDNTMVSSRKGGVDLSPLIDEMLKQRQMSPPAREEWI